MKFSIKYLLIICDQICRKLICQVAVSRARNNKRYLKIDIYFNHTSTQLFQASATIK